MILYDYIILPIEAVMQYILQLAFQVTENWGISLILLSLAVTLILVPLQWIADRYKNAEEAIKDQMQDEIDNIKKHYKGIKRHEYIKMVYQRHNYHPIQSVRASLGLLILIPFFFAAYDLLGYQFKGFEGASFLFIPDLAKPDHILWGINLMPVLMTVVSLLGLWITMITSSNKISWKPVAVLSVVFLVALYSCSAGLVLYWTFNNVFQAIKALIIATITRKKRLPHEAQS